jgi:hypothetical protein
MLAGVPCCGGKSQRNDRRLYMALADDQKGDAALSELRRSLPA